jgi:hypothetical protein
MGEEDGKKLGQKVGEPSQQEILDKELILSSQQNRYFTAFFLYNYFVI